MKRFILLALSVYCVVVLVGCGEQTVGVTQENSTSSMVTTIAPETIGTTEYQEVQNTEVPQTATTTEVYSEIVEIDTAMVSLLMSKGYTAEQASAIQEILNNIGITSIEIVTMTGTADTLNAVICYPNGNTDEDSRFHFTTDNGVLFYASFLGEDLYDDELGGYVKSYGDVHVPEKSFDAETFATLQTLAERDVKSCLNHPSSTDFDYFSWAVGRSDDHYKIIGVVTAPNSFGVYDDVHFSVYYVVSGDSFALEGLVLDGTRVK